MSSQQQAPQGPPYPSPGAQLGGVPTTTLDVPISAVAIALFVGGAALNMTILQTNNKRGHKFIISGLLFGFCMTRIVANVMRIVWACHPSNLRIVIAALIFASAGVIIIFIINLIFAQRIVRAYHPRFGWSRPVTYIFRALYASIGLSLLMVIVAVVYSFYTINMDIRLQLRDVQLTAVTYLAILSFLPMPITILAVLVPHRTPVDNFGAGSMRTKVILVIFTSALLSFGSSFRAAILFMPRPLDHPAWFHHKALYYCLNYAIELVVVYTYTATRFDRRFHIPNGSSAPGHYTNGVPAQQTLKSADRSHTDDDVLGINERPPTADEQRIQEAVWEGRVQRELEMREV